MVSRINIHIFQIRLFVTGLLILAFSYNTYAQQEPMYSQYMFNMLQINPAYAGNRANDNITSLYRKQWVGIPNSPSTATLSWDRRHEESNVGYGIQLYTDQLGIEKSTGVQAFYSYRIPFVSSSFTFGISGGALNYFAAYSQASTTQGGDPLFQEDINAILPTVGVGALYATNEWYAGLSVPALLHTKVLSNNHASVTDGNNHFFLTGGYIFDIANEFKLKPSLMIKAVGGAPIQVDYNLNAWYKDWVGIGTSFRTGDAFVGLFEIQVSPEFRLGYAYDYTISNLKPFNKGTHELLLRYEFGKPKVQRILSPRYY